MPQGWEWLRVVAGAVVAPAMAAGVVLWADLLTPLAMAIVLVLLALVVVVAIVRNQRISVRRATPERHRRERANLAFGCGLVLGGVVGLAGSVLGVPWFERGQIAHVVIAGGGAGLVAGARARLA